MAISSMRCPCGSFVCMTAGIIFIHEIASLSLAMTCGVGGVTTQNAVIARRDE